MNPIPVFNFFKGRRLQLVFQGKNTEVEEDIIWLWQYWDKNGSFATCSPASLVASTNWIKKLLHLITYFTSFFWD